MGKRLKRLTMLLMLILSIGAVSMSYGFVGIAQANEVEEFRESYDRIVAYAEERDIQIELSYEEFIQGYIEDEYTSIKDYEDLYINNIERYYLSLNGLDSAFDRNSRTSLVHDWYNDVGTSPQQRVDYSGTECNDSSKSWGHFV